MYKIIMIIPLGKTRYITLVITDYAKQFFYTSIEISNIITGTNQVTYCNTNIFYTRVDKSKHHNGTKQVKIHEHKAQNNHGD